MSHNHDHCQGHGHSHAPVDFSRAFAIGIALNLIFVLVEGGYGFLANSLALMADAGHNLSDVMTLLLAWGGMALAKRGATARHTYGFKKGTILVSLGSALFLYAAIGVILWEAVGRLRHPAEVNGMAVIVVAAIGVVINTATALLFMAGRKNDLNIKGAFLHMAADAAVSAGVVVAGFAIMATGWNWLDPLISIGIALVVLIAGWGLLKDSLHLTMAGVPDHIEAEAVLDYLTGLPGVQCVHDLHIWAASTTENVLTAHLVMPGGGSDAFLHRIAAELRHDFAIHHTTVQIEQEDADGLCHTNNREQHGYCWPGKAGGLDLDRLAGANRGDAKAQQAGLKNHNAGKASRPADFFVPPPFITRRLPV
ncbi:MAG: cation diffusion facilitator family transporter [Desulfobacteraceae bacterium]|nr:cation diffusion facilitator family transporter [Desulfobacteraceae bacterium]